MSHTTTHAWEADQDRNGKPSRRTPNVGARSLGSVCLLHRIIQSPPFPVTTKEVVDKNPRLLLGSGDFLFQESLGSSLSSSCVSEVLYVVAGSVLSECPSYTGSVVPVAEVGDRGELVFAPSLSLGENREDKGSLSPHLSQIKTPFFGRPNLWFR